MKKTIVISLILMLAAGALLAQRADRKPTDSAPVRERMDPAQRYMQSLNLSDTQIQKFAQARTAYERQRNTIEADLKNLRLDLAEAIKSENIRLAKDINRQISAKELELADARVDHIANQLKELNAEQKTTMLRHLPMMMGQRTMMNKMSHSHQMMQRPGSGRRTPGHGDRQRLQDCDDCDDCDGERKYKNRK